MLNPWVAQELTMCSEQVVWAQKMFKYIVQSDRTRCAIDIDVVVRNRERFESED